MSFSLPPGGSSAHGIISAGILDWIAMVFLSCYHCLFPPVLVCLCFLHFFMILGERGVRVGEGIRVHIYTSLEVK